MYYNRMNGSTQNTNLVSCNGLNCEQCVSNSVRDICPIIARCNHNIECSKRKGNCFDIIISILAALLTLSLGLILGIVLSTLLRPILSAIIIFALVMLVLLILVAIFKWCRCSREL